MKKYDFKKIEKKWQEDWRKKGVYEPRLKGKGKRKPFYQLMMFPYPSAEGLHVGNMYAFTGSDVYGRLKRMQGFDVFEPIGLDGFGIHSENYALKMGTHPARQAVMSEKRFYKQLEAIGAGFSWKEKLETYDPEYYRWTQWIFVQMFKAGFAYRKKQAVNWCPSCKTVLADEQVISGRCERCNSLAEKRDLEQWFFRITKYADKLLKNLDSLDWTEKVKIAQKNWIGRSEGAEVDFKVEGSEASIRVFTTRIDTIFSGTFLILAPEHPLVSALTAQGREEEVKRYVEASKNVPDEDRTAEGQEKTGVFTGSYATNPATGEKMPIWISDFVLANYGSGAVFADAHDERDFEMAKEYNIPLKVSLRPAEEELWSKVRNLETCFSGEGILVNSGQFDGLSSAEARPKIVAWLAAKGTAKSKVNYRLRDWLISRQRYWGPPIPMIYCASCAAKDKGERKDMPGWYAEKEKNLPVRLPLVKDFRPKGTGESPLATVKSFYEVKCPACKGRARRETDVSDTFLDSAWYYLRYPNVTEKKRAWDPAIMKKWFPVDMYTGGAEHSVLHLLYVRFITLLLSDLGLVKFGPSKGAPKGEPFPRFRAHGLVIKDGAKMSKSKGNVINPDEYISRFSADVLRMYLMFLAPFEQGGDFRDEGILGIERYLAGVRRYFGERPAGISDSPESARKILHKSIKKVTEDIENLKYNTSISQLMILFNALESAKSEGYLDTKDAKDALKLIAPFAPHLAEEIWHEFLGEKGSIHIAPWPKWDKKLVKDDTFELVLQVNGKVKGTIEVPSGISEEEAKSLALSDPKINSALQGKEPKRIVYVPGRLINVVL